MRILEYCTYSACTSLMPLVGLAAGVVQPYNRYNRQLTGVAQILDENNLQSSWYCLATPPKHVYNSCRKNLGFTACGFVSSVRCLRFNRILRTRVHGLR